MSIYTIDAEADIVTVAAGDEVDVFQTSTGRIKKATMAEVGTYIQNSSASSGSGTVTATANAGTLNNLNGVVTTAAQTATGQAPVVSIVITNSTVTVGDLILATIGQGTNTTGIPVLTAVTAAGTMTFGLYNAATTGTAAFAGTFVINYRVTKK